MPKTASTLSLLACALVWFAYVPERVYGQGLSESLPKEVRSELVRRLIIPRVFEPTVSASTGVKVPSAIVEISSDQNTAGIHYGWGVFGQHWLGISISGPVKDKSTTLVTGLGIEQGIKTTFEWKRNNLSTRVTKAMAQELRQLLLTELDDQKSLVGPTLANDSRTWQAIVRAAADASENHPVTQFGISVETSTSAFAYRDPSDVSRKFTTTMRSTAIDVSLAALKGVLQDGARATELDLVGSWKRAWKPGEAASICSDIPATPGALKCDAVILGMPTARAPWSMTGGMKREISSTVAIALRMTYAGKEGGLTAEAPIYFVCLDKKKDTDPFVLAGGVKVGWTKEKGTYLALFAGPVFKIDRPSKKNDKELAALRAWAASR